MVDIPERSEENGEEFLKEIEDATVISNVELLRMKLIGKNPDDPQDEETKSALFGIRVLERTHIEGGLQTGITIKYNTRTGEISADSGKFLGDFSILRTNIIEKQGGKMILLYLSGGMPASWEYDEAISGMQIGPRTGTRRIMPERLSPQHPNLKGINEVWGQSEFVENTRGDLIVLKSIRKFNETYGLPK